MSIQVAILDDHPIVVAGYLARLQGEVDIQVVATANYGEELEQIFARQPVDVLLLDVEVETSPQNSNPYPILQLIPSLQREHPNLAVLVISVHAQHTIIQSVLDAGATGYILKNDIAAVRELGAAVRTVFNGDLYMSPQAYNLLQNSPSTSLEEPLSPRQLAALSLAAAYPDLKSSELAERMDIAPSTLRNMLSSAYIKLNVKTRWAAVVKARQLGLITPETQAPDPDTLWGENIT